MGGGRWPIGVVLAGGNGRRIGGSKATVALNGRSLITYPLLALRAVLGDVAVIAKADTELPAMLPGVAIWIEQRPERHPLAGLIEALELAGGRAVVVCAVDLPFVTPELIGALAQADPGDTPAVVASRRGALQPLLGCYQPAAAALLDRPGFAQAPVRDAVAAIGPRRYEVADETQLFNVNGPEDLLTAAGMLDRITRR
jgi:molybdopterin-guanine dinucleotide biosynthesis protein A